MADNAWNVTSPAQGKVVVVRNGSESPYEYPSTTKLVDAVNDAANEEGLTSVIVKTSRNAEDTIPPARSGDTLASFGGVVYVFAKAQGAQ